MSVNDDLYTENMIIKAAWYYYKDGLTQNEIATLLDISRTKVVRLLDRARSEGIIQFQIKGRDQNCLSIEKEFKQVFALQNAFIIPTPPNKKELTNSLAKATAQFVQNKLQPHHMIALGWGKAISKTIDYLSLAETKNISVVTLTGGINYYLHNRQSQEGGMERFQEIHVIPAPFLASTEEMADSLLKEPSIKEILHLSQLAKYIIVGIGGVYADATIIQEENMTINELTYIKQQQAVGDILGQFFDCNGKILDLPHHKRLIGVPIQSLSSLQSVIGVAGGEKKVEAISGALKGRYIQTMITDEETAIALLNKEVKQTNDVYTRT